MEYGTCNPWRCTCNELLHSPLVERAPSDFAEVMTWITAHDGAPEATVTKVATGGLHGDRFGAGSGGAPPEAPRRFVLPPGALS